MTDENRPEANEEDPIEPKLLDAVEEEDTEDPIGDETDGEAEASTDAEEEIEDAEDDAEAAVEDEPEIEAEDDEESTPKPRPPAKLERLQKILAQSGVASRRKAEEMIEQGRVQVNGKVVTALGTKADAGRDHIRVDGKLLHGAERLRYFVLNKPRGFVTTVKDPEGRPTVMQFFEKMRERLYPVGRLDYLSEGLLLVTNDGELANKLTRAAAGVEKTYLVKVSGIPTEDELDILRAGVAIEKGKPGSGKVRTSPARIRQVRQGDNPWYEVVLIEGRNRELRKMFEEIGHFVEKIRRVGYGPLILDQEPGNLRELDAHELELLRKAADGKLRTPKAKEIRRRNVVDSLPPVKPAFRARGDRPAAGPKDYQPKRSFGTDRPSRGGAGAGKFGDQAGKFADRKPGAGKFETGRPSGAPPARPAWKKDEAATPRPPARFAAGPGREERSAAGRSYGDRPAARTFGAKPAAGRSFAGKPAGRPFAGKPGGAKPFGDRPGGGKSFPPKPAWKKPEAQEWPAYKRPPAQRPEATRRPAPEPMEDLEPRKSFKLHIEPVQDFGRSERATSDRARPERAATTRPPFGRSGSGRSGENRSGTGRSSGSRPFRSEGGLARPFTTSSGKPRAGGARPSSKPGKEGGRSFGTGSGRGESGSSRPVRPFTPRGEDSRPERRTGTGWKPKPNFAAKAGGSRPASSERSGPRSGAKPGSKPGGFSKSGYKGKPSGSGAKRSGPRPGGKSFGGRKPGGKRPS
jgi:23S rRNA pseudouridine2605 synthase